MHEVVLESAADRIYLCHDAKSRQGFADGALRAAEWLAGKKGFYNSRMCGGSFRRWQPFHAGPFALSYYHATPWLWYRAGHSVSSGWLD